MTELPRWKGMRPHKLLALLDQDPAVRDAFRALGDGLMAALDDRTVELVALRTSARRDCLYVWRGHVRLALALEEDALTAAEIARVAVGPSALAGTDRDVVAAVDALLDQRDARTVPIGITAATLFYDTVTTWMHGVEPEPDAPAVPGLETPRAAAQLATLAA